MYNGATRARTLVKRLKTTAMAIACLVVSNALLSGVCLSVGSENNFMGLSLHASFVLKRRQGDPGRNAHSEIGVSGVHIDRRNSVVGTCGAISGGSSKR